MSARPVPPKVPRDVALEIFEKNQALTQYVVKPLAGLARRCGLERSDLETYAMAGLWHAAQRFDATRGLQFSTYAYRCIRGYVLRGLNRGRSNRLGIHEHKRLRTGLVDAEGNGWLEDTLAARDEGPVEAAARSEQVAAVRTAIEGLKNETARVVMHILADGGATKDAAAAAGITRGGAWMTERSVQEKLRRALRAHEVA